MAIATYTMNGNKSTSQAKLNKDIFAVDTSDHSLLHEQYTAYLSNGRENHAKSLNRGEVRGGGRKPWRQKGTGRARFGSSRNPIWRGGGVAFGPTGRENHQVKVNAKARKLALKQAFSLAAAHGKLSVIEKFEAKEIKAKPIDLLLKKVGAAGRVLVLVADMNEKIEKSTRNISNVIAKHAMYANVYEVMNADHILMSKDALAVIDERLGSSKS